MPDPIFDRPSFGADAAAPPSSESAPHERVPVVPPAAPEWKEAYVPLSDLALQCLPKLDAVVLGAFSRVPIVAALAGFKAGYELAECMDHVQRAANLADFSARASETCVERGGTPLGVRGNEFQCEVSGGAP